MPAPLLQDEAARIKALHEYHILDTEPEQAFDDISRLAAYICETPIALISLTDVNRQWFKARCGLDATEVPRDLAFCGHAILQPEIFVIPDTLADPRFATNPLVTSDPGIRFYAGSRLMTSQGYALGTICALDRVPRQLRPDQIAALQALGRQVVTQLELRRNIGALARMTIKRKQADEALWQSKERFRNLIEQINDWVWEIDVNSVFTYVSPRVIDILGYEPMELLGKTLDQLMRPDEAKRYTTLFHYFTAKKESFTQLEKTLIHKSGHPVVCESSASPIFNQQGELQGYRGATRNITKRKQVEWEIRDALTKEKELSELKSRFINIASHEFRTPLTTILSSAEALEHYGHKWSEEKKLTYLRRIQITVSHLNGLLKDVLLIGKAEAGKLEFNPALLNLEKFCRELVEDLQLSVGSQQQIRFTTHGTCIEGWMDEKLLRHIFVNLLSNAIKYSLQEGMIDVELAYQKDTVTVRIQDSGIGIPLSDQERLFESFHRATNVGNISGTGLGLSIVKQAIDLHNGSIQVASEVGVGTAFTVTLPLNNG